VAPRERPPSRWEEDIKNSFVAYISAIIGVNATALQAIFAAQSTIFIAPRSAGLECALRKLQLDLGNR
jgi:hypothetical protein